jgi:hypothetical protein
MADNCKGDTNVDFDPVAHGLDATFRLTSFAGLKG